MAGPGVAAWFSYAGGHVAEWCPLLSSQNRRCDAALGDLRPWLADEHHVSAGECAWRGRRAESWQCPAIHTHGEGCGGRRRTAFAASDAVIQGASTAATAGRKAA